MKLKREKAFTLIELLVVIAIIAILSSAVLVYTKSTKDDAKLANMLEFRSSVNDILGAYNTGAWMFEGDTINDVGYDSSGYGDNCIAGGNPGGSRILATTSSADNILGQALRIKDRWLNCGSSDSRPNLFSSNTITLEAWAKAETLDNTYRGIITNKSGNNYGINLFMYKDYIGSRVGTIQKTSHNNTLVTTSWAPSTGKWYHMVVTYNLEDRKVILYVNGRLEKEQILPGTRILAYSSTNFFGIGCNFKTNDTNNCNGHFIGAIDEAKIYNESLTLTEVQKKYAQGLKRLELAGLK